MHHITECGTTLQKTIFLCLPKWPCQAKRSSETLSVITHRSSNKFHTMVHNSKAMGQWRRRWSIDSPFLLHMQHQSTIITPLFHKQTVVGIFPKAAVHEKKATLGESLNATQSSKEKVCQNLRKGMNNIYALDLRIQSEGVTSYPHNFFFFFWEAYPHNFMFNIKQRLTR